MLVNLVDVEPDFWLHQYGGNVVVILFGLFTLILYLAWLYHYTISLVGGLQLLQFLQLGT